MQQPTKLSVNVNKIATLRNTRDLPIPNIIRLARIALEGGAAGITVHPRPDARHIRPGDVDELAVMLKDFPAAEFNIEGNPFSGLVAHCRRVKPHQVTLVPDQDNARTSDHGWDVRSLIEAENTPLREQIERLKDLGCRVSLFLNPIANLMPLAKEIGADRVELYTEPYAASFAAGRDVEALKDYAAAAMAAKELGLGVNAGHDLSLGNLGAFLSGVHDVDEVSIGHALVADALEFGMAETVRRYAAICQAPR